MSDCPFCDILRGAIFAQFVREWHDVIAIVPLGPVVSGHTLFIPRKHVADFTTDPSVSAATMARAAEHASRLDRPFNIITSKGREATQSVFHLHLHLIPRATDDGLALPWYSGKGGKWSHGGAS